MLVSRGKDQLRKREARRAAERIKTDIVPRSGGTPTGCPGTTKLGNNIQWRCTRNIWTLRIICFFIPTCSRLSEQSVPFQQILTMQSHTGIRIDVGAIDAEAGGMQNPSLGSAILPHRRSSQRLTVGSFGRPLVSKRCHLRRKRRPNPMLTLVCLHFDVVAKHLSDFQASSTLWSASTALLSGSSAVCLRIGLSTPPRHAKSACTTPWYTEIGAMSLQIWKGARQMPDTVKPSARKNEIRWVSSLVGDLPEPMLSVKMCQLCIKTCAKMAIFG